MKKNDSGISTVKAMHYIFKASPLSFAVMAAMGLINGGAAVLSALCIQKIFSAVQNGYTAELAWLLAAYSAALILSAGYSVWYMRYRVQFHTILNFESAIRKKLHAKSRRISNDRLETPNAYAFIRQADGARQSLFRFGQIYVESAMIVVQAAMVTAYMSVFQPWFLIFLPLAVVPVFAEMLYQAELWNRAYEGISQSKREEAEYERAVTDEIACKETRMTGADGLLISKYADCHAARDRFENSKSKKMLAVKLALSIFVCAGSAGGFITAILLLYFGRIDISVFTASIAAYSSLAAMLGGLAGTAGNEAQYKKMIAPYFRYWNMAERTGGRDSCSFERQISLKDVSFKYPGQNGCALEDINLTVNKGEVIAVVGENGAGKTTLANIITGLYAPSSGAVYYDGANIAEVNEYAVHKIQSAVFQNFVRYKLTAGENIAVADFSKRDDRLIEADIKNIFPDGAVGENTLLGKEFGGVELSGGQWQKLAIARGFYKNAQFIVLDEPTSAIDPLKEKEIYDEFKRGLEGRTGIIVTHRLGAVNLADRIVVLKRGRIAEYGTKQELIAEGGEFFKFWNSQKNIFVN